MISKPIFSFILNVTLLFSLVFAGFKPPVQAAHGPIPLASYILHAEEAIPKEVTLQDDTSLYGRLIPSLTGVMVQALSLDGNVVARADIHAKGRFTFSSLPNGYFNLRVVDKDGQELKLASESLIIVTPEMAQKEHLLYLELSPSGEPVVTTGELMVSEMPIGEETPSGEEPVIQPTSLITGVVTAADTSLPISDVFVQAFGDDPNDPVDSASTDSTGVYTLSVYADTYYVYFDPPSASEYAPEWYDNQPDYYAADPVVVTSSATVPNINAVLEVGGQIIGQVTATDGGAPLANIAITAYYEDTTGIHNVANGYTDGTGIYAITGLAAGTYYLEFDAPSSVNYVDEFYNNQPTLATADPIAVTLGGTTPVSVALDTGAIINGTITVEQGGATLSNAYVYVYTSTLSTSYLAYDSTSFSGDYELLGLRAGTYYLKFEAPYNSEYLDEYYNNQPALDTATPIAVASEAVVTIDAALETGATIEGTVTAVQGGTGIPNVFIEVYTSTTSTSYLTYDYTDGSGTYQILGLNEGTYYLKFEVPYNSDFISEYYNNQATLETANPISVNLAETVTIDASLETGGMLTGAITGVVGGAPIEDVLVRIYDENSTNIETAYTNASGVYTVTGLLVGEYFLYFQKPYGSEYLSEYYANKKTLDAADPVAVALNTVVTIDASLETGGTLTGIVTAEEGGAPLASVAVRLFDSNTNPVDYVASDSTDASGQYTFIGLEAGSYYLRFTPPYNQNYLKEYHADQPTLAEADGIAVALNTVVQIDAELATGGILVGQVKAVDTGLPLEDVWVDLYGDYNECGDDYIDSVYTDETGVFTFTQLATGIYYLALDPGSSGVSRAYLDDYISDISVTAGETTPQNALLERGGQILGIVTAEDTSLHLEDVYVRVYEPYEIDEEIYYSTVSSGWTDVNGVYTSTGLTTGDEYIVRFEPNGVSLPYLDEFYNNANSFETADMISVTQGSLTTNINAVLTRGGQIMGQVTAEDTGLPLEDVYIRVYTSTLSTSSVGYGYTDANGVYTTSAVISGDYFLMFDTDYGYAEDYINEYYNNASSLANADPVDVTLENITPGKDAVLALGGKITGNVTAEDTGDGLDTYVDVFDANGNWIKDAYTEYDSDYEIPGLPSGTYYLLFEGTNLDLGDECVPFEVEYEGRYYEQKLTFSSADPVIVVVLETTSGIDGVLPLGSNQPPWPGTQLDVFLPIITKP